MKNTFLILLILLCIGCKDDPCEDINCINEGTCINGECSCPPAYEGPACEQEKTPASIRIGSITVNDFPLLSSDGSGWDLFSAPDLVLVFEENVSGDNLFVSNTVENVTSTGIIFPTNIIITAPSIRYQIILWDDDEGTSDDRMGGISFEGHIRGQKFPTSRTVSFGEFSFTMNDIRYVF